MAQHVVDGLADDGVGHHVRVVGHHHQVVQSVPQPLRKLPVPPRGLYGVLTRGAGGQGGGISNVADRREKR